jgi:hypothetical protein
VLEARAQGSPTASQDGLQKGVDAVKGVAKAAQFLKEAERGGLTGVCVT